MKMKTMPIDVVFLALLCPHETSFVKREMSINLKHVIVFEPFIRARYVVRWKHSMILCLFDVFTSKYFDI